MRLGLLLGGGGAVGIAWENGVLAGLADATGFDPASATVIIGTSAGAAVGADMALGKDPHDALANDGDSPRQYDPPDLSEGAFAEIIGLMMAGEGRTPEGAARIGRLAIEADPVVPRDEFLERFRTSVGTDEWPDIDFRPTAACCETGEPRFWTAADGIGLSTAVASSCAIPGFFPPVPFEGAHYMDGSRGRNYHTRIADGLELDAAVYIGPKVQVPGVSELILDDMAALAASGVEVLTILGSETLDAAGLNLMDFGARPRGFEIGLADGADQAAAFSALIGSG